MKRILDIAIVGATGLVGEALLSRLAEHPWLNTQVSLLGGGETCGQRLEFGRRKLIIDDIFSFDFSKVKIVVAIEGEQLSPEWLGQARASHCIVLEIGSSLKEGHQSPPLVAAVNPHLLSAVAQGGTLKLADAATTQLTSLLKPIDDRLGLTRVAVFSCHAVSELGRAGVEELARQTAQLLNGKPATPLVFPAQIAFNLLPTADGHDQVVAKRIETNLMTQTRQLLDIDDLELSVICSWAPVFFGHSQAITLTTRNPLTVDGLYEILADFPDIEVIQASDSPPTAVTVASGKDTLTVGRVRHGARGMTEFSLWTVADNLRFGIAGNLVRILEILVKNHL